MPHNDLDIWWTSLPIKHKERIARKAVKKASPDGTVDESKVQYPACTSWWNSLSDNRKLEIHDHCVDRHGYLLPEWNEAAPYDD